MTGPLNTVTGIQGSGQNRFATRMFRIEPVAAISVASHGGLFANGCPPAILVGTAANSLEIHDALQR